MKKNVTSAATALLLLALATPCEFVHGADDNWSSFIAEWDALVREAEAYYDVADYDAAIVVSKQALELAKHNVKPDHFAIAESLNNLAFLYHNQGKYVDAEPLFKQALAIREKAANQTHVITSLNNLAELYRAQENYAEAELYYKRALKLRERRPSRTMLEWQKACTTLPRCTKPKVTRATPSWPTSAQLQSKKKPWGQIIQMSQPV